MEEKDIPLEKINITGDNPRKKFDVENLAELASSLLEIGQLQSVLVRPDGNGGYDLAAGERRYHAAQIAFMDTIRADIRDMDDQEFHEVMALENLHREDLSPMEEAFAVRQLLTEDVTQQEVAERIGKSQGWVANRLRLLKSPDEVQQLIISREISNKHAKILLRYKDYKIFDLIMDELHEKLEEEEEFSSRDLEGMIESVIHNWGPSSTDKEETDYVVNPWGREWRYGDWIEYFDNSKCSGCKHISEREDCIGTGEKRCMKYECFSDKIEEAKQKAQEEEEERMQRIREKDLIDTNELEYGEFKMIKDSDIDIEDAGCHGCEEYELDIDEEPVCMDPSCYKKRKEEKDERDQQRKEKKKRAVIDALESFLEDKEELNRNDYERMISRVVDSIMSYYSKKIDDVIFEPYFDVESYEELEEALSEIPDEKLQDALLRAQYFIALTDSRLGGTYFEKSDLEDVVPEALEYYEEPDPEGDDEN